MNNVKQFLNNDIEDLLKVINTVGYELNDVVEYYRFIQENIDDVCKDLNLVNAIHESIRDNRNLIIEVAIGMKDKEVLEWRLYTVSNITLENIRVRKGN